MAAPAPAVSDGPKKVVAAAYAKKLAKQHKLDVNTLMGTGPFGRITPEDVEAAARIAPKKSAAASNVPQAGPSAAPKAAMQSAVSKNTVKSLSMLTFRVGYPVASDAWDKLYEKGKPKVVMMSALLDKAAAMAIVKEPVLPSISFAS